MSNNPYDAPESKVEEVSETTQSSPLSRASGTKKLLLGVPLSLICSVLAYYDIIPGITRMLAVIMGAYAIVGLIEVIGGESLVSFAKKWDSLPGWKKFIFSLFVIITAFVVFMVIAVNLAKLL